jgi:hypothetical protein
VNPAWRAAGTVVHPKREGYAGFLTFASDIRPTI